MFKNNKNNLWNVAQKLIESGTPFLAVPHDEIAKDKLVVYYMIIGHNEDLNQSLNQIESVRFAGQEFPIRFINVLQTNVHFESRVPVFADNSATFGLNEIPLNQGVENLREAIDENQNVDRNTQETIELKKALQSLRDKGAAAVMLDKKTSNSNCLRFTAHVPPATGATAVEQYHKVTLGGKCYEVDWTYTIDGPGFMYRVPVYSRVGGQDTNPVTVEEGLENVQEFLNLETECMRPNTGSR